MKSPNEASGIIFFAEIFQKGGVEPDEAGAITNPRVHMLRLRL